MIIRNAKPCDARQLACLINLAGEHLPEHLWSETAAEGQDPLEIGAQRAARNEGAFSYRNVHVAEIDGQIAGMLLSYRLPDPDAAPDPGTHPATVRPLVELESMVPGSWYVNAIATHESFRGRGVGTALLGCCEDLAGKAGAGRLSLIVASENGRAFALYKRLGYRPIASRLLVAYPGGPRGGEWILMVKKVP